MGLITEGASGLNGGLVQNAQRLQALKDEQDALNSPLVQAQLQGLFGTQQAPQDQGGAWGGVQFPELSQMASTNGDLPYGTRADPNEWSSYNPSPPPPGTEDGPSSFGPASRLGGRTAAPPAYEPIRGPDPAAPPVAPDPSGGMSPPPAARPPAPQSRYTPPMVSAPPPPSAAPQRPFTAAEVRMLTQLAPLIQAKQSQMQHAQLTGENAQLRMAIAQMNNQTSRENTKDKVEGSKERQKNALESKRLDREERAREADARIAATDDRTQAMLRAVRARVNVIRESLKQKDGKIDPNSDAVLRMKAQTAITSAIIAGSSRITAGGLVNAEQAAAAQKALEAIANEALADMFGDDSTP